MHPNQTITNTVLLTTKCQFVMCMGKVSSVTATNKRISIAFANRCDIISLVYFLRFELLQQFFFVVFNTDFNLFFPSSIRDFCSSKFDCSVFLQCLCFYFGCSLLFDFVLFEMENYLFKIIYMILICVFDFTIVAKNFPPDFFFLS